MDSLWYDILSGLSVAAAMFIARYAYVSKGILSGLRAEIKTEIKSLRNEIEAQSEEHNRAMEEQARAIAKALDKIADVLEKHYEVEKIVAVIDNRVDNLEKEKIVTDERFMRLERPK